MVEPCVFTMASVVLPCSCPCRTAMRVSIVSPDWEMATTSVRSSTTGSRYRNSCASSTSTGIRHQCSMAYLATWPAYAAVPQATTTILSMLRSTASSIRSSSSTRRPAASVRPSSVSATACGWSAISLSMKDRKPPFSAAAASQSTVNRRACAGFPSKSVTCTEVAVIVTISSWPSSRASRVCAMNAATSEPRKFSPSPSPTTSGESCRAPTTSSGWSACTASSVNVPSNERATVAIAAVRSPVRS